MVTGASTANLAIVLVDARKGLVEQSRRHAFIASLLRIPHLVLAVNKMDLVDWTRTLPQDRERVPQLREQARRAGHHVHPDQRAQRRQRRRSQQEHALVPGQLAAHHLENVHIASDRNLVDARFPVQWVIRPQSQSQEHHDYRGYAGQVAGGVMKPGDEVVVLPSGFTSKIARIETFDGDVPEAFPPMSVTVHLADDLDVSRGDMICRPNNRPFVGQELEAMVCWMSDQPLQARGRYAIKHTTKWAKAMVTNLQYRLDINTLHREEGVPQLKLNDIGRVSLRVSAPLAYDEYRRNRATGSFILVDEATNNTVGAGMLLSEPR
jgi:bifunctional enzyme CysN/CysC